MMLRSDIWVSAYIRQCSVGGASAFLRRRGASEAGSILIKIDKMDGSAALYAPAPYAGENMHVGIDRMWRLMHDESFIDSSLIEDQIRRELRIDPDLWIIEVEDKKGRSFLDEHGLVSA